MSASHNPGFHDLASGLGDLGLYALPTCAVVCLDFSGERWSEVALGRGTLVFQDSPKEASPAV